MFCKLSAADLFCVGKVKRKMKSLNCLFNKAYKVIYDIVNKLKTNIDKYLNFLTKLSKSHVIGKQTFII